MSDRRGIILDRNVNLEWIRNFEPKYFPDYIKFVVNAICFDTRQDWELKKLHRALKNLKV